MEYSKEGSRLEDLRKALRDTCEYADHLGKEMAKLGDANYCGDFVNQYRHLLESSNAQDSNNTI
jgi:hypothetical protein